MKTPITYYGGKQRLVKELISLLPDHQLYVEAFAGGGALFFAKEPGKAEIINDTNGAVINFYSVAQSQFAALKLKIDSTLHSRGIYKEAYEVYKNPQKHDPVTKAWAFWVVTNQGFSGKIGSWAVAKDNKIGKTLAGKRESFTADYAERLKHTQIESADALKIIERYDAADTFFYLDPPYFNSDCGHYKGYSEADFFNLLELLSGIKGKFLLSCYPSEVLTRFIEQRGWQYREKKQKVSVSHLSKKQKTEVMVFNYVPEFSKEVKEEKKITKIKKTKDRKPIKNIPKTLTNNQCKQLLEKHGETYSYAEAKRIKQLLLQVINL